MSNEQMATERTREFGGDNEAVYEHPAFGVVTLSSPTGGNDMMFGSDLRHNQRMCIRVDTATLHRHLGRDWIHSDRHLIEFELSFAQFAQFITSQGCGGGTPCTLRWIAGEGPLPGIAMPQSKHETHREEVKASTRKALERMQAQIDRLGELIESGKVGKKDLAAIHRSLKITAEGMPENLAFAVESAEEALEKATSDAKIDVEAYIDLAARRIGLEAAQTLGLLPEQDGSAPCK